MLCHEFKLNWVWRTFQIINYHGRFLLSGQNYFEFSPDLDADNLQYDKVGRLVNWTIVPLSDGPVFILIGLEWFSETVHSDAFFKSQRDINRQCSWLDFWKIQVNLVNFISGTFGTAWDKNSKNGLTFGCLKEKKGWNFDLEIIWKIISKIY